MNTTKFTQFSGTDELRTIGKDTHSVEETSVFHNKDGVFQPIPGMKGLFDLVDQKIVSVVSEDYQVLQNRKMINLIADSFDQIDVIPDGKVCDDGHRISVEIHLPAFSIDEKDHNLPIYMGARIRNSYNSTVSFGGFGYIFRTWCENGAYVRHALPEINFSVRHIGDLDEKVPKGISDYVNSLEIMSDQVSEVINNAKGLYTTYKSPEQVVATLQKLTGAKRASAEIYERIKGEIRDDLQISNYDIWNGITSFASHGRRTDNVSNKFQEIAETVLNFGSVIEPITV